MKPEQLQKIESTQRAILNALDYIYSDSPPGEYLSRAMVLLSEVLAEPEQKPLPRALIEDGYWVSQRCETKHEIPQHVWAKIAEKPVCKMCGDLGIVARGHPLSPEYYTPCPDCPPDSDHEKSLPGKYVAATLRDGTITAKAHWGFDEQQADPFHRSWKSEHFVGDVKALLAEVERLEKERRGVSEKLVETMLDRDAYAERGRKLKVRIAELEKNNGSLADEVLRLGGSIDSA